MSNNKDRIIKKWESFLESYTDELNSVLENEDNSFVILKGNNKILVGFEYLEDCFIHIIELIESDGLLEEDTKYELLDDISEHSISDDMEQIDIDELLDTLLDKYDIIHPYKIKRRDELDETINDMGIDNDNDEFIDTIDDIDELEDDELEQHLSESNDIKESNDILKKPFKIVGKKSEDDDTETVIDSFDDKEEAEDFLNDYKEIYDDYSELYVKENINYDFDRLISIIESTNDKNAKLELQEFATNYVDELTTESGLNDEADIKLLKFILKRNNIKL